MGKNIDLEDRGKYLILKKTIKYLSVILLLISVSWAQGVNLSAQEELDARYSGVAGIHLGFEGRETSLSSHPAAINDIDRLWLTTQHINRFSSLATQNNIVLGFPLSEQSTLAFGISHFGGNFIARTNFFDSGNQESFFDVLFLTAYGYKFDHFDIGVNTKIIYRQLDQFGIGIQADASIRYFLKYFQFDAYLSGLIPSSVQWNNTQLTEIQVPELFLSIAFLGTIPQIYGKYRIVLQTQGFIQNTPKSIESKQGGNLGNIETTLKSLKLATEFQLDGGLALRIGFSEISNLLRFNDLFPSYGIGYVYKEFVRVDYSFQIHPELESTHAVSLSVSPWWGKFQIKRPKTWKPKSFRKTLKTYEKITPKSSKDLFEDPELLEDEVLEQ